MFTQGIVVIILVLFIIIILVIITNIVVLVVIYPVNLKIAIISCVFCITRLMAFFKGEKDDM